MHGPQSTWEPYHTNLTLGLIGVAQVARGAVGNAFACTAVAVMDVAVALAGVNAAKSFLDREQDRLDHS